MIVSYVNNYASSENATGHFMIIWHYLFRFKLFEIMYVHDVCKDMIYRHLKYILWYDRHIIINGRTGNNDNYVDVSGLPPKSSAENVTLNNAQENRRSEEHQKLGPMLNITRKLLDSFYKPFNEKLANLLNDKSYLWLSWQRFLVVVLWYW